MHRFLVAVQTTQVLGHLVYSSKGESETNNYKQASHVEDSSHEEVSIMGSQIENDSHDGTKNRKKLYAHEYDSADYFLLAEDFRCLWT